MARSLTNAYWIEVGTLRERKRILDLLDSEDWDDLTIALPYVNHIAMLIKGEKNE